jgi:hypothetical protein
MTVSQSKKHANPLRPLRLLRMRRERPRRCRPAEQRYELASPHIASQTQGPTLYPLKQVL